MFLCAIRDGHSRKVLGHSVADHIGAGTVATAIEAAVATRGGACRGTVPHSDRAGRDNKEHPSVETGVPYRGVTERAIGLPACGRRAPGRPGGARHRRNAVHRGKAVRSWLDANADLKRNVNASRAHSANRLAHEIPRFPHRRLHQPHIVRGHFRTPHVRYATV